MPVFGGGGILCTHVKKATTHAAVTTYQRRFRWSGGAATTPSGDVRAYLLSTAAAPDSTVGHARARARAGSRAAAATDGDGDGDGDSGDIDDSMTSRLALDDGDEDGLIEAATLTTAEGYPSAWVQPCPAQIEQTVAGAGCSSRRGGGTRCVCIEACSSGLLFWATLAGSAATESSGADLRLMDVVWAGACNATFAVRSRLPADECAAHCSSAEDQGRQHGSRFSYD